jgi:cytochrome P450
MSKAFAPKNVQLVHFETARQTGQMLASWEAKLKENCIVVEKSVHHQTMTLALHVILAAGYGYAVDWDAKDEIWERHRMALKDAIRSVIDNVFVFIVLPPTLLKYLPSKYFQMIYRSYEESKKYFKELIELERRGRLSTSAGRTFLSSLVENSAESNPGMNDVFSEEEVMGNTFLFFIAGHETTYFLIPPQLTECICPYVWVLSHGLTPRSSTGIIRRGPTRLRK